jgi:DNA-binding MarR family transcriptional regulator
MKEGRVSNNGLHPDLEPIQNLDPAIHSPSRLMILAYLGAVKSADFTFLLKQTKLTRGNLATHLGRLEDAGFIDVKKEFVDRIPRSLYKLTKAGKDAIQEYRSNMRQVIDQLLGEI